MSMRRLVINLISTAGLSVCLLVVNAAVSEGVKAQALTPADAPGRPLMDSEIADLDSHVWPDGTGLPTGSGRAVEGEQIYAERCVTCHGSAGEGGSALELVGDHASLSSEYPDRGIAAYWASAPTLFEYIRRAMPPQEPWSMSIDQTYAVVAWLLELNGLLVAGAILDAETLSAIKLPNRDGFIDMSPSN